MRDWALKPTGPALLATQSRELRVELAIEPSHARHVRSHRRFRTTDGTLVDNRDVVRAEPGSCPVL
jgi:hypothetical protein